MPVLACTRTSAGSRHAGVSVGNNLCFPSEAFGNSRSTRHRLEGQSLHHEGNCKGMVSHGPPPSPAAMAGGGPGHGLCWARGRASEWGGFGGRDTEGCATYSRGNRRLGRADSSQRGQRSLCHVPGSGFPDLCPEAMVLPSLGLPSAPHFQVLLSVSHKGSLSGPRKLLQMPVSPTDTTLKEKQNEPGATCRCCRGNGAVREPCWEWGCRLSFPQSPDAPWARCFPSSVSVLLCTDIQMVIHPYSQR